MIAALGARVHLLVRPVHRGAFTVLFRDALSCDMRELDFGLLLPILLVSFPDGSAFSVEFASDPPEESSGTWIEFRTDNVPAVQQKLREAGVVSFRHPGSSHDYFRAPGGQVFRVLDVGYRGP